MEKLIGLGRKQKGNSARCRRGQGVWGMVREAVSAQENPNWTCPAGGLSHEATSPLAQVAKIWDAYIE